MRCAVLWHRQVVADEGQDSDFVPVNVALIQSQSTPAAAADESRQIKPIGRPLHLFDMFTEARFEAGGGDAVAAMISEK